MAWYKILDVSKWAIFLTFVDHMNNKTGFDHSQQFQNVIPRSGLVFGFKVADANNRQWNTFFRFCHFWVGLTNSKTYERNDASG